MKNLKELLYNIKEITAITTKSSETTPLTEKEKQELKILFQKTCCTAKEVQKGEAIETLQFNCYFENNKYISFNLPVAIPTGLTNKEIEEMYLNPELIEKTNYEFIVYNQEEGIQRGSSSRRGTCPSHITFHHWEDNIINYMSPLIEG